jgi:hypothetical protein
MGEQGQACLRRPHAARNAIQKRSANGFLKPADALAGRSESQMHGLCSTRNRTATDGGDEKAEIGQIETSRHRLRYIRRLAS